MQQLLASLVVSMGVRDAAFKAGMATARKESQRTAQDFDTNGKRMGNAITRAAEDVNRAAFKIVDAFDRIDKRVKLAGIALTAGLTVGLAGLAKSANGAASDFQSSMNDVHAALVTATPEDLARLKKAAQDIGPAFGRTADEAASAMADLARNGLSVSDILNGGLRAALTLAVVGQTDLGTASDATSDILQQFGKTANDLPDIVDKVSGALDVSKLDMNNYKLAIGQVGGVAGGLGYSFEDMNTALAATSSYFDSGSDAGTSFKTFLLALTPQSKQAEYAMKKLGLSFYDAQGRAKSLGDIAEQLKRAFGDLNDRSRTEGLAAIFGTDGMRTALALMKEGRDGIDQTRDAINKIKADQKLSILLDGEAQATNRLSNAWVKLKVAIGEAGLIQAITAIKNAVASLLERLAASPPWILKVGVVFGALAAATGPVVAAMAVLAKVAIPALILGLMGLGTTLGRVALGFSLLVNPMGTVIALVGRLAVTLGAQALFAAFGGTLLVWTAGLTAVAAALYLAYTSMTKTAEVAQHFKDTQQKLNDMQAKAVGILGQLATAQGKYREQVLLTAKAHQLELLTAAQKAGQDVAKARGDYAAAQSRLASQAKQTGQLGGSYSPGGSGLAISTGKAAQDVDQARVDLNAAVANAHEAAGNLRDFHSQLAAALAPEKPKRDVDFDMPTKDKKGRDTSADAANYAAKLAELQNAQLDAQADLTGSVEARYRADVARLEAERADYDHQLQADQGISSKQADILMAEKDKELGLRRQIAEQERFRGLAQQEYDIASARNDIEQELARGVSDLAISAKDRRAAELKLLNLQQQQAAADVDLILATKDSASAEYQNALDRKKRLPELFAAQHAQTMRDTAGPGEKFLTDLKGADWGEQLQGAEVDSLNHLTDGLTDVLSGTKKVKDAFRDMTSYILQQLLRIELQKAIIQPIAQALFGGGNVGGGGSGGGFLSQIGSSISKLFGGGKATGGPISASKWYVVGEKGPELFAPGVSGTVIPNGGVGAGPSGGPVRLQVDEGPMFRTTIRSEADGVVTDRTPGITAGAVASTQDASNRRMINIRSGGR